MIAIYDSHDGEHLENCTKIKVDNTEIPFSYSKYCNIGIKATGDSDIILCNDDIECIDKDFFYRLQEIAYKYPICGVLSPLVDGGIDDYQKYPAVNSIWDTAPVKIKKFNLTRTRSQQNELFTKIFIAFVCVYIKRETINQVGLFDESFTGYGYDDFDYAFRIKLSRWEVGITRQLHIKHGEGGNIPIYGKNWSCSFSKSSPRPSNRELFLTKWKQYQYLFEPLFK